MSVKRMVITTNQACQSYFDLTACTMIMAVCANILYISLESHLRCGLPKKNLRKLRCKTPLRHRYLPRCDIDALSTKKKASADGISHRRPRPLPELFVPASRLASCPVKCPTSPLKVVINCTQRRRHQTLLVHEDENAVLQAFHPPNHLASRRLRARIRPNHEIHLCIHVPT